MSLIPAEGGVLKAVPRPMKRHWLLLLTVLSLSLGPLVTTTTAPAGAAPSHAPHRVPDFVGLNHAETLARAEATVFYYKTVGPGAVKGTWARVLAQHPSPGTLVPWNFIVTLDVGTPPSHQPRPMPNMTGLNRAQAFVIMKAYGFYFTTSGPGANTTRWNRVVGQYPYAGTLVAWHAHISLKVTIAKPTPKPKPKPVPTTTTSTTTTVPVTTTTSTGDVTTTSVDGSTTTTTVVTTTTTVKVTTTTVKKKVVHPKFRIGVATWYSYIPGQCAASYLPMGTRVVVENLRTGRKLSCLVTDHEAAQGDRVIDLSETQFAELSPLGKGVVRVKVSW